VTTLLAERYGDLVPTVLASTATGNAALPGGVNRAWMLLEERSGVQPEQRAGAARSLAPVLADLQPAQSTTFQRWRRPVARTGPCAPPWMASPRC
jgi:hypothetical protein